MKSLSLSKHRSGFPSFWEDFFPDWLEFNGNKQTPFLTMPAVNIEEGKDHFSISMAVPGMQKDDFKIEVTGNELSISAEKETSNEDKSKKFTKQEYNYSSFSRSFTLPGSILADQINAAYTDGVLKLKLPKKKEAQTEAPNLKVKVN
ncbi:Hsp20/alpha crystallin family protein [Chitinophaga lutea]|uniref:Hsp20/alpha crystallin family protein n=1 Tax=Chitinophaga lutea TaxID=2488634 RepID=A0A3N4PYY5_9BACT|nr:Hsp20/alpha crystallin family protein [Chitinophaga lutea]RPE08900.1 Hsp20/alpha crystallin family protein [Chitinophaga lutea]